jgi:hypothetical protein
MHDARDLGGVGNVIGLLDRKGIHIGADSNNGMPLSPLRHHARPPHPSSDAIAQSGQHFRHPGRSVRLPKAKFRMGMNLPPPGNQLLVNILCSL